MKREELIEQIRDKAGVKLEDKMTVSKAIAKAFLEAIEETIHEVVDNEDSVTVAGIKVSTKKVEAKTGVLGGKPWATGERVVPNAKFSDTTKQKLTKELD